MDEQDKAVIEAVTEFVYRRHSDLAPWNVIGFDDEELARLKTDEGGSLVFTVEDVEIKEKLIEDGDPLWYVSAALSFQVVDGGEPIEGSTDIYRSYRSGDSWYVEWYAS